MSTIHELAAEGVSASARPDPEWPRYVLGIDPALRCGVAVVGVEGVSRKARLLGFGSIAMRGRSDATLRAVERLALELRDMVGGFVDTTAVVVEKLLTTQTETRVGLVTTTRIHERIECALELAGFPSVETVSEKTWRAKMLRGVRQPQGARTRAQRTRVKKQAASDALTRWIEPGEMLERLAEHSHDEKEAALLACYLRERILHERKTQENAKA